MPEAFCVVCDRRDVPTQDGVCVDCYAKHHTLVRTVERASVVLCPTCGARKVGARWVGQGRPSLLGADDLAAFLRPDPEVGIRRVDWIDEGSDPLQRRVEGEVALRFRGSERTEHVALTVRIEHRSCPDCSRRSGHFYTALIQLRASEDGPRERAADRRARLAAAWERAFEDARPEWRNALSWSEELPEGLDFYLTDTTAARALARSMKLLLPATLKESASLWGRKDGQDVYRVTFCLRVQGPPPGPTPGRSSAGPAARARRRRRVER